MGTFPKDVSDDLDLDALMIRVREAAMNGGTSGSTASAPIAGDQTGRDVDLMRVIEAQGEWNEHTRKSLAAMVESLRTLRDDWTDAQARLRHDVDQLSALVDELRTSAEAAAARARRAKKSTRGASTRQTTTRKRRRS